MSFDLGFWFEKEPSSTEDADRIYARLAGADGPTGLVEQSSAVADFYAAVVAVFPDLAADQAEHADSPWTTPIRRSAEAVIVQIVWSRHEEVTPILLSLAGGHGLTTYDPQAMVVQPPTGGDLTVADERGESSVPPSTGGDLTVANERGETSSDPSAQVLRTMLEQLGPDNRFLTVTRHGVEGEHYAQVYFEQADRYAVEYRDGSAAEHHGATAPDLATAQAVLTGWAEQRPGWQDALTWEQLDVE
jgi:hypothetical protein